MLNGVRLVACVGVLLCPGALFAQSNFDGRWQLVEDQTDRGAVLISPLGRTTLVVHTPDKLAWAVGSTQSREYDLRAGGTGVFQRDNRTYSYTVRAAGAALLVEEKWTPAASPGDEATTVLVFSLNRADELELVVVAPILDPRGRNHTARLVYRKVE